MSLDQIPQHIHDKFEIHEWRHASAILASDFPDEWQDLLDLLEDFKLCMTWLTTPGGRKSMIAKYVDDFLFPKGWVEKQFHTAVQVDETLKETPTHRIDCFKNKVGMELEWNNKDPFFDRDLNNFRLLFDLGAVSVGVIITRCDELQGIFNDLGRGSSFGASTTHMSKLLPRIDGGGGAGCPILVIGIRAATFDGEC